MIAIALALLGAIGLGGVAVSARGTMQGAHPIAVGVAQLIGGRSFGMVAINIVGASRTSLFIAAQAPFAAFFAIAFAGEALHPLVVVGAVLAVAGVIAVALGGQL